MIYNGKVVKTADFGAFVNFLGAKDGLVHISELAQGRVDKTTDVVNEGDAGEGQGPRLRRPRQGQAVDAGRRSGDRAPTSPSRSAPKAAVARIARPSNPRSRCLEIFGEAGGETCRLLFF